MRLDTLAAGSAFTHFGRTGTLVGPRTGGIRVLFAGGSETCWGALLVAPLPANVRPLVPPAPTCACGQPARRRGYCAACIATRAAAAADDLFGRRTG